MQGDQRKPGKFSVEHSFCVCVKAPHRAFVDIRRLRPHSAGLTNQRVEGLPYVGGGPEDASLTGPEPRSDELLGRRKVEVGRQLYFKVTEWTRNRKSAISPIAEVTDWTRGVAKS